MSVYCSVAEMLKMMIITTLLTSGYNTNLLIAANTKTPNDRRTKGEQGPTLPACAPPTTTHCGATQHQETEDMREDTAAVGSSHTLHGRRRGERWFGASNIMWTLVCHINKPHLTPPPPPLSFCRVGCSILTHFAPRGSPSIRLPSWVSSSSVPAR